METLKFTIHVKPVFHRNFPKLKIYVDDQRIYDDIVLVEKKIEKSIELADDSDHQLKITLHGKNEEDTVVDDDGNILNDQLILIKDLMIDDVSIIGSMSVDQEKFYYEHNGNGSHELKRHPFFDTMGCNGDAVVNFSTPFYVWLLETL